MPESVSEHVQWIVTRCTTRWGSAKSSAPVSVGRDLVELDCCRPRRRAAALVALHVVIPAAGVSLERVVGSQPVVDETGDKESVTLHVIVTGELFQPAPLGAGATVGVITGGVVSDVTVVEREAMPPLSSVIVTETDCRRSYRCEAVTVPTPAVWSPFRPTWWCRPS